MKRVTHWPQAVLGRWIYGLSYLPTTESLQLGIAFNWGALLGWSAVAGTVDWSVCLPLYASGVSWTLVYDSIYAHQVSHVRRGSEVTQKKNYVQDKMDDIGVGIRSTALLFGDRTRPILTALSATSLSFVTYAGYLNSHGAPFYLGVSLAAAQLARIIYRTDYDQRQSCWQGFVDCGWSGFWIWMGALADYSLLMLA